MWSRVSVSLLISCGLLCGQQADQPAETIRVDVDVVNVPVTVTDNEGKYIVDLNKDDFEVYEDGQRVAIRYFTASTAEEAKPPLWVGFLVELSNTARIYYKSYKESIGDLAYILIPEEGRNKGFLMGYHTEVDLLVETTADPYPIAQRMEGLKHGGGSAMLDAIYAACTEQLASATYQGSGEPRKVIVIVGDGHDQRQQAHPRGGNLRSTTQPRDDIQRQHGRLGFSRRRRKKPLSFGPCHRGPGGLSHGGRPQRHIGLSLATPGRRQLRANRGDR